MTKKITDTLLKIQTLWDYAKGTFVEWKVEVWDKDLDQRYCCDGRECCCGGQTVRDVFVRYKEDD